MNDAGPTANQSIDYLQQQIEQEKGALARTLHDDLGGHLIATAMDLSFLKHRLSSDPVATERLERAAQSLGAAIVMMRKVTEDLHPTLLDNVGLFAALRWKLKHMCHHSKLECHESLPTSELSLSPELQIMLFRAAEEAIHVAESQANASQMNFQMSADENSLYMKIFVNGSTETPAADSPAGRALQSFRRRVLMLGGDSQVESSAAGGLQLTAQMALGHLPQTGAGDV